MAPRLPESWHEVADPDHIVKKYRARDLTLFVREDDDVGDEADALEATAEAMS